jgi:hypothetical protein
VFQMENVSFTDRQGYCSPQVMLDYSFYGVNGESNKIAPPESMQFGRANEPLILALTRMDPQFGDSYIYKIDISDGFNWAPLST